MAQNRVKTARFGDIQIDDERIIEMVDPIFGFDRSKRYVILDHAENSPFKWFQSVDESELAFVVTNPAFFGIEYDFEVPDDTVARLGISSVEDVLVLTIVNIPQSDPSKMTANLLGPVVINQGNRRALQVVLNDARFTTKTRLMPDSPKGAAGAASEKSGE